MKSVSTHIPGISEDHAASVVALASQAKEESRRFVIDRTSGLFLFSAAEEPSSKTHSYSFGTLNPLTKRIKSVAALCAISSAGDVIADPSRTSVTGIKSRKGVVHQTKWSSASPGDVLIVKPEYYDEAVSDETIQIEHLSMTDECARFKGMITHLSEEHTRHIITYIGKSRLCTEVLKEETMKPVRDYLADLLMNANKDGFGMKDKEIVSDAIPYLVSELDKLVSIDNRTVLQQLEDFAKL